MGIYLAEQTVTFLYALLVGAGAGLLYDLFRISRIAIPTPAAVVFVQDIVYFLICAAATFLLMMASLDGKVRAFLLIGEVLGAVLYFATIGQLVMRVAHGVIRMIKGILRFIFRWLLLPVYRLVYLIVTLLLRPMFFSGKIIKILAIRFKFRLKMKRVLLYNHYKYFLCGIKRPRGEKHVENRQS